MAAMILVMVLMMSGPHHGYGYMVAAPQADTAYTQVETTPQTRENNP